MTHYFNHSSLALSNNLSTPQEYEIEMLCPRTKKWIRKGKCAGDKFPLFFDVDGLEEGQEYLFRVKAINDEGESEPLEGDKPIKAKNAFGEFRNNLISGFIPTLL